MGDKRPVQDLSLIQRSILPASVGLVTTQESLNPNDAVWYVERVYQDGSALRSGPYTQAVAARCSAVLAQAFAVEWEREAGQEGGC